MESGQDPSTMPTRIKIVDYTAELGKKPPSGQRTCILAGDFTKELGKKPSVKCWGCGKKEKKGLDQDKSQKKFRQCPKCMELKLMPCLFCSDECFHENWSRHHKKVHKVAEWKQLEQESDVREQQVKKMTEELTVEKRSTDSPYMRVLREGTDFIMKMDFMNAKKKLRKAQKINPKLPDAYTHLGKAYYMSGHKEEGLKYMEAGIERWALVCVTGQYGDEWFDDPDIGSGSFVNSVYELVEVLMQQGEVPAYNRPAWFCNDFVFKRIIELMREMMSKPNEKYYGAHNRFHDYITHIMQSRLKYLNLWQGCVLFGILHNGIVDSENVYEAVKDRTAKDLTEAAEYLKRFSEEALTSEDYKKKYRKKGDISWEKSCTVREESVDGLLEYAKVMEATPRNSAPFYKGCFVLVFGLTSAIGKTQMNKKLGAVKTSRSAGGRYGVQIDGLHEPKRIRARNLMLLPLPDRDVALVSCMAPAAQWKYLRPIGEGYAARLPDPH